MLKRRNNPIPLAVTVSVSILIVGLTISITRVKELQELWYKWSVTQEKINILPGQQAAPSVIPLISVQPAQRASQLEAIAAGSKSLERSRARYLLASDLIEQKQGAKALQWLEGLEKEHPILAELIAFKRAQAYESMGDKAKAQAAWEELLQLYPQHPVAAEALYALGRSDPQQWDKLIAEFPGHPRTIEIVRERLKKNPHQLSLLRLLLKHDQDNRDIGSVMNQMVTEYALYLTRDDWEALAFLYWQKRDYGKAGKAYSKAPAKPLNLYRAARGLQLGGVRKEAMEAYQKLIREFPDAKDTGLGLIRLAELSPSPEALTYLDQVINKFPDDAGAALLAKAKILEALKNSQGASQARELALSKYGNSDEVAEFRWQMARSRAKAGDFLGAWQWAQPITQQNPDHELAPEAAFWIGKWAQRLANQKDAQASFEFVLSRYPESYYAWRSAGELGMNVGTFTNVRQILPKVVRSVDRPALPAGSTVVQELYQLGQYRDARALWQTDFHNYIQPTIAEQFTDGVLLLGVGQNIQGLHQVESLGWWRDTPEEKSQLAAIKQQPGYWHALYPFPFLEHIQTWSGQRQLNPLLVTGLIRQESRFEPTIRSFANAVGLMQVLPSTASWIAQKIDLKNYSLENPSDNIKLGTWYLDHTHEQYKNNSLLAVASYNAGPGNVAKWIKQFNLNDPDEFVEDIPFPETQGYVKHVFENYWNYMRLYNPEVSQLLSKYKKH